MLPVDLSNYSLAGVKTRDFFKVQMATYMYKYKDMVMMTKEQYLDWKKTLPGLRMRVQLDRSVCNC